MSLTNPNTPVSQQDLQDFYHKILPYMSGEKIQLSTMPTASDIYETMIVQYVGVTDANYTNGYFYKCTESGGTYSWVAQSVQAGGGGGNINDETPTFTEAGTRANIASGEKISVIMGKIQKFFTDLKTVAFSGSYSDLSNKPDIPDELADLTPDSTHRVVTDMQIASWSSKQAALTPGTGIDITNNVISATGGGGTSYTAGDGIVISDDEISVDEMASADMDEIITPLPSVQTRYPKYSTSEQVVGTWIDGKPIYQKTFEIDKSDDSTASFSVNHGISNIDKSWFKDVFIFNTSTKDSFPVPGTYINSSGAGNIASSYVVINNTLLTIRIVPSEYNNTRKIYVTIQYTKTTD